jgi:hypothetical protein
MTDKELNITLRELARSCGLCDKWYEEWTDDSTIDECLDRYIDGIDFAIEKDYPSMDFIRKNFRTKDLHKHNIFVDDELNLDGGNGVYVLLGNCKGTIRFDNCVATIYIRHDSHVEIESTGGAIVFVRLYDKSSGECAADKYSKLKQRDYR